MEEQQNYLVQLHEFLESKGLTTEEASEHLIDVFRKAFEKEKDAMSRYETEVPEPADVTVDFDINEGTLKITRKLEVVEEKTIQSRFKQIELNDERIKGKELKIGDIFEEVVDLENISISKRQHIDQLFKQKLSEAEKIKVYKKFSKFKGEILNAKVHKVLNRGNIILDYNGDSIFMPSSEVSPLDKIYEGDFVSIYVLEIEELSKDAQIIASRRVPEFVTKLIERENTDVVDGVVKIEGVAREVGVKTKIAVSSTHPDVDPVGSLIGPRGNRIKIIVDEISGERVDAIKYSDDIKQFIAEALSPAEVVGVHVKEKQDGESEWNEVIVVVDEDQFLTALGKRGVNIKLAAILTKTRIDVKTVKEAQELGIAWEPVEKTKFVKKSNKIIDEIDLEEFSSIEDIANDTGDTFTEDDYDFEEIDYSDENEILNEDHNYEEEQEELVNDEGEDL